MTIASTDVEALPFLLYSLAMALRMSLSLASKGIWRNTHVLLVIYANLSVGYLGEEYSSETLHRSTQRSPMSNILAIKLCLMCEISLPLDNRATLDSFGELALF